MDKLIEIGDKIKDWPIEYIMIFSLIFLITFLYKKLGKKIKDVTKLITDNVFSLGKKHSKLKFKDYIEFKNMKIEKMRFDFANHIEDNYRKLLEKYEQDILKQYEMLKVYSGVMYQVLDNGFKFIYEFVNDETKIDYEWNKYYEEINRVIKEMMEDCDAYGRRVSPDYMNPSYNKILQDENYYIIKEFLVTNIIKTLELIKIKKSNIDKELCEIEDEIKKYKEGKIAS